MTKHVTITIESEHLERAEQRAATLGLPVEEYLRQLVINNIPGAPPAKKADVSELFDLGASDEPTDIGRDKDKLIGEAVWKEHLRKTGQL